MCDFRPIHEPIEGVEVGGCQQLVRQGLIRALHDVVRGPNQSCRSSPVTELRRAEMLLAEVAGESTGGVHANLLPGVGKGPIRTNPV